MNTRTGFSNQGELRGNAEYPVLIALSDVFDQIYQHICALGTALAQTDKAGAIGM
ncbi:hypothetical protein SAMN04488026_11023 [Aliiruegeria lutimaris]|uniref:Uncharacterized protein n=1 Tax=Aliiruegeria lutimaris TaxID=571298 RepID=A0A1G9LWB8_9RHOB|nr:hypothetical protein SAMN04488026_11023 [Aliiruegeria lutimaris]